MDHLKGHVAVLTGASAGIGAATAIKLVKAGLIVVGIARRLERLQILKKSMEENNFIGRFYPLVCDVTDENDILNAFKWIDENIGGIHFMINNAGIIRISPIMSGATDKWEELINCNVMAPTICSREAYKLMKKYKVNRGHIIQINSITGHSYSVNPGNKMYNASKQALRVLTEGLRHELAAAGDFHIKATSISPGFVDTEIFDAAKLTHAKLRASDILSSEEMADMIAFVMSTGPNILIAEMIVLSQGRTIQSYPRA
ncbi:Short-chain dehydrogenase/reductase SDR,NAD(P)-binding domain [Cinara cedri]|uniref:Short-chain dehydrogenase/reductase SDR,NAD(P)-binding domain n=1 Tax=Cinara cedri TaxID=506608 RepID=A0A5E4MJL2_9HEMI|nr:Short-chain dehydrogenase/reductase SDR,NAD(P)-binding domain [Cinara cedri]